MELLTAAWVLPIVRAPIRDGGVLVDGGVDGGVVVAVGTRDELAPRATQTTHYDGLLMPGLVNAHAHLQYGPSFADLSAGGHAFPDWLLTMTERRKAMSDAGWRAEVASSWELAYASGTVAVADIVTTEPALDVVVPGVRYLESVALASTAWPAEQERLTALLAAHPEAGLSPHTLYTLGADVITGIIALARRHHRRLHPHLAETSDEDEFVRHGSGPFAGWPFAAELRDSNGARRSPAEHLDDLGGLGPDVHVAHGTHLHPSDRALLRQHQTPVALCARSNAILGSGTPPVAALLNEHSPIAVGTDSLASTPDLDLLNEVRALATLAASQGYTDGDLATRLLEAATCGGAAAIGRSDLGHLSTGARAALVQVSVEDPHRPDIAAEVVRSGRATPLAQADSTL